jgi:putative redox protein
MVEISVQYEGNFRCRSIHGPSGAELATDAPRDNLGKGEAFSPTDLTATSLAACMLTTMAIVAKKSSWAVDLSGVSARVRKHMTPEPPRRIAKLEVDVTLPLPATHPDRAAMERTALTCPVFLSLHPEVEKVVAFDWAG